MKIIFDTKKKSISISDCTEPVTIEMVQQMDLLYETALKEFREEALWMYGQEIIEKETKDKIFNGEPIAIPINK